MFRDFYFSFKVLFMELRPYRKRVYGDGHYSHTVYSCFCDIYIATLSDYRVRCIRLPCQEPCNIGIARGIYLFLFFFSEKKCVFALQHCLAIPNNEIWYDFKHICTNKFGLGKSAIQSDLLYKNMKRHSKNRYCFSSEHCKTKEVSERVNFSLQLIFYIVKMRNLIAKPLSYNDVITKIQGNPFIDYTWNSLLILFFFIKLSKSNGK